MKLLLGLLVLEALFWLVVLLVTRFTAKEPRVRGLTDRERIQSDIHFGNPA